MAQRLTIYTHFGNLHVTVDGKSTLPRWGTGSALAVTSIEGEELLLPWSEVRGLYLDPTPDPDPDPAAEGDAPND